MLLPLPLLLLKVDSVEHCDKFWYWLQAKGINSNRSGIVNAIAEKVNTWIPGERSRGCGAKESRISSVSTRLAVWFCVSFFYIRWDPVLYTPRVPNNCVEWLHTPSTTMALHKSSGVAPPRPLILANGILVFFPLEDVPRL